MYVVIVYFVYFRDVSLRLDFFCFYLGYAMPLEKSSMTLDIFYHITEEQLGV